MAKLKTIVIFEAGPGASRPLQDVLREVLPGEFDLEEAETILIPAEQWNAVSAIKSEHLADANLQRELVARQLAYMEARHWQVHKESAANAYQDAVYSAPLESLYFIYSFGGTAVLETERKAETLYVEPVPSYKFRRPGWIMITIGTIVAILPIALSFLFPNVFGAVWVFVDLLAILGGFAIIWRGGITRLRKAPITYKEKCAGCGRMNRFTNVVKLNCHRCGEEIAYQLRGKDDLELTARVQAVKCPHCNAVNNLRFRRLAYTCTRCEVRHTLGTATLAWLRRLARRRKA
ncbi:MAG: hypothetical protein V2J07_07665 [Anaerolineae bacterium]|jgi:hypothetical protein|nr:hypothetical protein [Anaerolineae bacterium]